MGTIETMESYDLRNEIDANGQKYYIQTHLVASQRTIVCSLFHEGTMLSKQVDAFAESLTNDDVRTLVRQVHEEKQARIQSLLAIKDKLSPTEDGRAHLKLSEALFNQSLYRESMAEVVRAVKLGVTDSKAYSILGNSLLELGDSDKAIKAFLKGLDISPTYPDLHNDLGRGYLKTRRCRDAVKSFERAAELNKYYYDAYMNLAIALCLNVVEKDDFELSRGLNERLKTIMAKLLQLRPMLDNDDFKRAQRAVETKEYDVAYDILTRLHEDASKTTSNNHLSLDLYLILKFNSENLTEADIDRYIERTRRALDANPGYADLQNNLGILYTAKCKLYIDKAKGAFQTSLALNENFKKAEKNLKLTENDGQGIHLLLRALLD